MGVASKIRRRQLAWVLLGLGGLLGVVASAILLKAVDGAAFREAVEQARHHPAGVGLAVGAFGAAFMVRAVAWKQILPTLTMAQSLAGIHVAMGANHVLPFRMGEPLRVLSVVRRTSVTTEEAAASAVMLRTVDLVAVVALGVAAAPTAYFGLVGWGIVAVVVALAALAAGAWVWLRSVAARGQVRRLGPAAIAASVLAWPVEALLVWQVAGWAGMSLTASEALLVTTVSVAAQVIAVAPGGIGTYEAAGVAAYVALGFDADAALVAAIGAHGLKTVYAVVAGLVAAMFPAPSLLGRLRLGRQPP